MDKRYQVFVSSTYADLKDERSKVIQTLMEMDCIPAGMELFPAMDEEQFEFIKKIIDDCDYYLLILGARYGSIAEEDGLSFTEKEFRYAKEKGMKIIALVHGEPDQLPVAKTDKNPDLYKKLVAFRNDVCTNRLVKFWHSSIELPGLVALNLPKTIKAYPAIGWIRGDGVTSNKALTELLSLKQENEELRKEVEKLSKKPKHSISNLAGSEYVFTLEGTLIEHFGGPQLEFSKKLSFKEIFKMISPMIMTPLSDAQVRDRFEQSLVTSGSLILSDKCYQTVKFQLEALELTELTIDNGVLYWGLTPQGKHEIIESFVVRTE